MKYILPLLCLMLGVQVLAIPPTRKDPMKFMSHLNLGVGVSSLGPVIEVSTPINPHLKVRTGYSYVKYNHNTPINFEIKDPKGYLKSAFGYVPSFDTKVGGQLSNAHLLLNYHPAKNGAFYITVGAFVGKNQLNAHGFFADESGAPSQLLDPSIQWPTISFDGYILDPNKGSVDARIEMGKALKPYIGFGVGRVVPRRVVSFNFDCGMIYQGKYRLYQDGVKLEHSDLPAQGKFNDIDTYARLLKWWPMLNFRVNFKLY